TTASPRVSASMSATSTPETTTSPASTSSSPPASSTSPLQARSCCPLLQCKPPPERPNTSNRVANTTSKALPEPGPSSRSQAASPRLAHSSRGGARPALRTTLRTTNQQQLQPAQNGTSGAAR